MKKAALTLTTILIYLTTATFSQSITLSSKNLEEFLCKTWESDYVLVGSTKVTGEPSEAGLMIFEFKRDKTLVLSSSSKEHIKGTWIYDQSNKIIKLKTQGVHRMNIISIKSNELIMRIVNTENGPSDMPQMKLVFKPKG